MKIKNAIILVLSMFLALALTACGSDNNSSGGVDRTTREKQSPSVSETPDKPDASPEKPDASPETPSEPENEQEPSEPAQGPFDAESNVFPISYQAYDRTYTYTGYKIGTNEEGKTTVTLYGSDNELSAPINEWNGIPFIVIEVGGELYGWNEIGNGEAMLYTFETSESPERIIITQGNTGDLLAAFNVTDEPQS